jgi:hypothetical protein
MKRREIEKEWKESWNEIWLPAILTKGKPDLKKIKKEMYDLWFIYRQVGKVYCELTGNKLSKPMYYAETIIQEHENQCNESYENGYTDAQEEFEPPVTPPRDNINK